MALRIKDCEPATIVAHEVDAIRIQYPSIPVIKADEQFFNSLDKYPSDFKVATKSRDCVYQYTSGTTRELPEVVKHSPEVGSDFNDCCAIRYRIKAW